jgi:hypothetical protein
MTPHYGAYDGFPCRWIDTEAWIFVAGVWREISPTEAATGAALLNDEAYHRNFGHPPPIPSAAFHSAE